MNARRLFCRRLTLGCLAVFVLMIPGNAHPAFAQSAVNLQVTFPTTQTSFSFNQTSIILRGTAGSAAGIQQIMWESLATNLSGLATGQQNWEINNISLRSGLNRIQLTARDFAGATATVWLNITYQPDNVSPQIVVTTPTAGSVLSPQNPATIAWHILGTIPDDWPVVLGVPDMTLELYRNGEFVTRLYDQTRGTSSLTLNALNFPEGDNYRIHALSRHTDGSRGRFIGQSGAFRIGPHSAPSIASFTATAPNGEESTSVTVKLGEQINFRWKLTGGTPQQSVISPQVGTVVGRASKLIAATQLGSVTYTLSVSNSLGSDSRQILVTVVPNDAPPPTNEVLHNGIILPAVWPPANATFQDTTAPPPYLVAPPTVIPINVGRQLLVDDFLIESATLTRQFHSAVMHPANPVLSAATAVENSGDGPMAMPFSNGVFYDSKDRLFKMWYMCGYRINVCYATSNDGVNWTRPSLDVVPGTNIVFRDTYYVDGYVNWIDEEETNPARRYKMLRVIYTRPAPLEFHLHYSADGIHWGPAVAVNKSITGDRTTFFYNPFRKVWVLSLRDLLSGSTRVRRYVENRDLSFALNSVVGNTPSSVEKTLGGTSAWVKSDNLDTAHPNDPGFTPQLYDLDVSPYESLLVGQFAILRGDSERPTGRPKLNEVYFGFSRDGFHWHRPHRQPVFAAAQNSGSWNWGNLQPVGGGPLVVGDNLYFYFSGRAGRPGGGATDTGGATGLAIMRRDGFASMNAGDAEGTLLTRKISFNGKFLFVNAQIEAGGSLCVEALNQNNQVIQPFSRQNCQTITGTSTKQMIAWTGASDLSAIANQPVKLRFYLRRGKLFSFWVSPAAEGYSRGYVGAGGPAFSSFKDEPDDGAPIPSSPPTAQLSSNAQTIILGQTITLTYATSNAQSASISPSIPGCTVNVNQSGACQVTPTTTGAFTYTLTALGNGQTASSSATVTATVAPMPPVISSFTSSAQQIQSGQSVNLSWNLTGGAPQSLTLTPGGISVLNQSSQIVSPSQTTTYRLTATNAAGSNFAELTITVQPPETTPPSSNRALRFDGQSGYVSTEGRSFTAQTKTWTMEVWIRLSTPVHNYQTVLGNGSGNDIRLFGGAQARVLLSTYNGAFANFFGSRVVNDGVWHHVAAVRNQDRIYLYIDGQPDTDSATGLPYRQLVNNSDSNFGLRAIGNRGTPSEWYGGDIDDVRIYKRALSQAEILAHYNNGAGIGSAPDNGLAMGFDFNEESGGARDFSGSLFVAPLYGGVARIGRETTGSPVDTTPPVVTLTSPSQTNFPAGTSQVTIGVNTNEAASCRYSADANLPFAQMSLFAQTGSQTHAVAIATQNGQSYSFALRCADNANNVSAAQTVNFSIQSAPPADTTPPVVTIISPSQSVFPANTTQVQIGATTNEQAVCRFADNANLPFAQMTLFAQTGAATHSANIAAQAGQSYQFFVRCADAAGNVSNAQTVAFSVQSTGGTINRALQLDGMTGYVEMADYPSFFLTQWTISVWVKSSSQRIDFMTLFGNGSGNDLRMAGGVMALSIYNGAFSNFIGTRRINDGQWHHVVAMRDGDRLRVYIDGQVEYDHSDSTQQGYFSINNPAAPNRFNLLAIGNRGTPSEFYQGLLDEARMYARALTHAEALALYNNGLGTTNPSLPGLLAEYNFDEDDGPVQDTSGNGRAGILKGGIVRVVR